MTDELTYALVVDERVQKAVLRAYWREALVSRRFAGLAVFIVVLAGLLGAGLGSWFEGAFGAAFALAAMTVMTSRRVRRSVERVYPIGTTPTTAYGDREVAFSGATLPTAWPYAELGEPAVADDLVTFRTRTAPSRTWIVPAALCPPDARARIAQAADAPARAADADPRFTHSFVAGDETARAVAAAAYRRVRLSWRGLRTYLLAVVVVLGLVALAGDWRWTAIVLVFAGIEVYGLHATRRGTARLFPPGSTTAAGFTEDALLVRFPVAAQELSFADLGDVWWNDDAVVLRDRVQRQCVYAMPRGLFGDEDLAYLRERIAG